MVSQSNADRIEEMSLYPLAACRPRPLDPPVTTATFPSSEKMLPKSSSWTSSLAEPMLAAATRIPWLSKD